MINEEAVCNDIDKVLTDWLEFTEEERARTRQEIEDEGPTRIPCSYPGCDKLTTWDTTYGDLCAKHCRASNE